MSFHLMNIFLCTFSSNCEVFQNIQVIPGYRCFADRQVHYNITPMHHYSCRHSCITNKLCLYILQHVTRNHCLVSNGPCLWLEPDTAYSLTVIRRKYAQECVEWVPLTSLVNIGRKHDTCGTHRVGRANIQSNMLLGSGGGDTVYTVLNGGYVSSKAGEWLDVQPGCKVSWIPFTGGDAIPNGAVQGGYLYNSGTHQPIYVMGAVKGGGFCTTYGYYDPGAERGYFEYHGVNECTEMYLMIFEWYELFKERS